MVRTRAGLGKERLGKGPTAVRAERAWLTVAALCGRSASDRMSDCLRNE